MQAVGQLAIDVEGEGVVGNLPDSRFFDRNRVSFKLVEEGLREACFLHEQATLDAVVLDEHAGIQDMLVHETGSRALLDLKREAAAGNPLGLVTHGNHLLAADRDLEPP